MPASGPTTTTPTETIAPTPTTGAAPSTTTSTSPPSTISSSPGARCTAHDLGIHYVGSNGTPGTVYETFAFINVSSHPCKLYGYPGVSLVLTSGKVDDITTKRDPAHPPKSVTVAPGAHAPFIVGVHSVAAHPCVSVRDFRFIPPDDTAYEQIAHPVKACGASVTVSAVGYR